MSYNRKKGGRPKLDPLNLKTENIGFKVDKNQYKIIKEKSNQVGLRVGEYCREVSLKQKMLVPKVGDINFQTWKELNAIGRNLNQIVKYIKTTDKYNLMRELDVLNKKLNKVRLEALGVVEDDSEYN